IQLVSEPVAAAAYYAYQLQQSSGQSFTGNLLICDMGGGTFDVTLCTVEPGHVNELHNDGNGSTGLGTAGVFFDRALILENGKKVTDSSPEFFDLYNRMQEYKVHNHSNITKLLINAMEDPDQADSPVMRSGAISVNYRDIQKAFEKVEAGILDVLQRFKKSIDQAGYSVDAVFFVGGFAQFYLVREAIKKFWNIQQDGYRFIENINKEISRYAIAYGAALIANGMMSVEEKYIHTIGIEGYKLTKVQGKEDAYMQETVKMPIIEGGKKLGEYENIIFARNPVKAHHEYPEIVIYVDPESKGSFHSKKLPESLNIKLPGAGNSDQPWRVGMRIDKSKIVYLIFEDMQGKRFEYELGDLLRQMFGGLEVLD
ncbi:MAG: Hsp70 family protein, partial [Deltaproteobacteria bacterium]